MVAVKAFRDLKRVIITLVDRSVFHGDPAEPPWLGPLRLTDTNVVAVFRWQRLPNQRSPRSNCSLWIIDRLTPLPSMYMLDQPASYQPTRRTTVCRYHSLERRQTHPRGNDGNPSSRASEAKVKKKSAAHLTSGRPRRLTTEGVGAHGFSAKRAADSTGAEFGQ